MEVNGGRHCLDLSSPGQWTQLAVVSVCTIATPSAELLFDSCVFKLDAAMDAEVTRRIVDVIFHRQRGAESDNSMRDESTEALSDFVFELLLTKMVCKQSWPCSCCQWIGTN